MSEDPVAVPKNIIKKMVHPGLDLLEVEWQGLSDLLNGKSVTPVPGKSVILLLPGSDNDRVRILTPSNLDLLALKIVAEGIDSKTAAREAQVTIGFIDNILYSAGMKGFLLLPPSKLVRGKDLCKDDSVIERFCSTPSFTLQWHITQRCDIHCRHCYDRSDRTTMTVEQGVHVLDDLYRFCQEQLNRLAMVGEGAALASVEPALYADFLTRFISAAAENPALRLKDNLCNLHLYRQGKPLHGGCAGVGCGAAFNFVSLLPDGEIHACRKLPSLLGNIYKDSLTDIYQTPLAERYRMGSSACRTCTIRPVCGGCPAVSFGFGRDIFSDLDPYCFKDSLV